jgi:hypothetical protein
MCENKIKDNLPAGRQEVKRQKYGIKIPSWEGRGWVTER